MIGGTTGILGEWGPESAENRYEGPITLARRSRNRKMARRCAWGMNPGVDNVIELCHNAGIKSPLRPYPRHFLEAAKLL